MKSKLLAQNTRRLFLRRASPAKHRRASKKFFQTSSTIGGNGEAAIRGIGASIKSKTIEQTAFGNYLTYLLVVIGLKSNHASGEADQAYAAMNKSATIYENLGPANEAFAPFTGLAK